MTEPTAGPGAPPRTKLDVATAVARVTAGVSRLGTEQLAPADARGQVLAAAVLSTVALPPWNNSGMDGYAVRAADVAEVPTRLTVLETIAAGAFPAHRVDAGQATRIMTGAPIPDGADSVIRVEDTDGGRDSVEIRANRDAGKNVRARGEDITIGGEALPAGVTIGAAQLGVLAAIGTQLVEVFRRPRVAILTSGDELVPPERFREAATGRKIVSSNSVTLAELVRESGGEPIDLGIAADTRESIREHLAEAAGADLIITSGGISVGEFDYMREVIAELGGSLDFWRVRMRPGAPIGFGTLGGTPWIGLPGNPVSTMVTFELFARPAIRKMRGHDALFRSTVTVTLDEPVRLAANLTHYLRAVVTRHEGGRLTARLTGPQSSGVLSSMARANVLLIVPQGAIEMNAGEILRAIPLGPDAGYSAVFGA
ncbi:MAG: molybdopterin molybdotransferase MoeA [Gemmatimonadetes bacterium]|nr:molybdopterin molybdotransferase MoeA [Gemmatimonadota bacterium]